MASNIALAKSKQKGIDAKKEKLVAHNIALAKSKQKGLNKKRAKTIAANIMQARKQSNSSLGVNHQWIKYIAKTSYDVMWDWDIALGEIYVGDSVEELFGYKVINNRVKFSDFTSCLPVFDRASVEKKLLKALGSGKRNWNDSFMLRRLDGSLAATTSRASIVRDEKGKAIRLIGALQDITRVRDLETRLKAKMSIEEKHKILLSAKLAFDVIWDWNLVTNEAFIGEGFEELFGYPVKNNKGNFSDWADHIHPDDKESFEISLHKAIASTATQWDHAYRFTRADGSIASVFDRASIIRHTGGKAYRMIGAMKDISRQKELEERLDIEILAKGKLLTEYKESFKLIFNSSPDVLYDCDLEAGKITMSDAFEKEFGYKISSDMTPEADWSNHIHPDDKEAVLNDYRRMLASEEMEWKYSYRFLKADDSVANILGSCIILRNTLGKAYRMIGSMQDISKQKVLEERLEQEIKLKEKQIAEATEDAKDSERSDIGKELHDNINQLLGVSRMYLEMAKRGGDHSELYLGRSSEYTLTAIEELRKLTKGLTTDTIKNLGLCEAIEKVTRDTMEVNPIKISYVQERSIEHKMNDKFKLNIFRIVQEQLNNILKHARATEVEIRLSKNKKNILLTIADNGVGFNTSIKHKGIGIDNIKSRAASFKGSSDFVSQPGQGCILKAIFPISAAV